MRNQKNVFIFASALLAGSLCDAQVKAQAPNYSTARPIYNNETTAFADVLRVDPIYETFTATRPREECYNERVVDRRGSGGDPTGGTVLGAIVGAALGNQVGKGDGRRAATIAGAVVGGAVGRNIDQNNGSDPRGSEERIEKRCRVIEESFEERRIMGYEVEYRYRGDVFVSRLDYDPGERLRVRVLVEPVR